jgi:hypothetical protein
MPSFQDLIAKYAHPSDKKPATFILPPKHRVPSVSIKPPHQDTQKLYEGLLQETQQLGDLIEQDAMRQELESAKENVVELGDEDILPPDAPTIAPKKKALYEQCEAFYRLAMRQF